MSVVQRGNNFVTDRRFTSGAKAIPYAGECRVIVLTVDGHPELTFARSSFGKPRDEFVDEVIRRLFGEQKGGAKHEWEIVAEAASEKPTLELAVDKPELHDWLVEKMNG
jgi:hypothetical protein